MHNFLGDGMPTRRMFWTEIGAIWTQQFVGQCPPRLRHGVMSFRDGFLRRRTFIDKGGIFPGPVEDHSVLSVFLPLIVFGGRFVYDDLGPCTSSVATTCVPCRVSRSGLCNSWVPGDWDVFFLENLCLVIHTTLSRSLRASGPFCSRSGWVICWATGF